MAGRTTSVNAAVRAAATTERQIQVLDALDAANGVGAEAARALGVNRSYVNRMLLMLEEKASGPQPTSTAKKIMVLPDVQAKPGTDFSYLMRIGQYMVEKKPDVVVCIGDFADMQSLSSYDKGKKSFEGRRYKRDVEAAIEAMSAFLTPLVDYNATAKRIYKPRMVLTLGNHEERILRAINEDPKLDGVLSIDDLKYKDFGWEVIPFLEVIVIEGVAFSHYFTTGTMGRPAGTAAAQLRKTSMSSVAGHQQGKQIAYATRADGSTITSIIAGSCYEHDEDYLGAQGNRHWRGCLMLHEVIDGAFDEMWVSLGYINKRYPNLKVAPNYAETPMPELAPR